MRGLCFPLKCVKLFLDIDGVLQPGTQKRFGYRDDIPDLCAELEWRCGGRYPYTKWHGTQELDDMDIAAVYYDWNRDAVERLRYALEVTGSGIVLSTSWREVRGCVGMSALLAIHGLDRYLCGFTETSFLLERRDLPYGWTDGRERFEAAQKKARLARAELQKGMRARYGGPNGERYVSCRTCEIREYLDRHLEIVAFAAVDDMNLELGLDGHSVQTSSCLNAENLERLLSVLALRDGPYPLPSECRTETVMEFQKEVIPLEESEWMRKKPVSTDGGSRRRIL